MKEYTRECPECKKTLIYKSYFTFWRSRKDNLSCRSCAKLGKTMPPGFSEKISKIFSGEGNPMFGRKHTQATKDFISENNRGNKSKSGQKVTNNSKKKMREAALNRIDKLGASVSYNTEACSYMDTLKPEYNFQHAMNGGEFRVCGYSVDGYDKEKNVVFEYDEPHHYNKNGELRKKDVDRMNEIRQYLSCKFHRYNQKKNKTTIYEY